MDNQPQPKEMEVALAMNEFQAGKKTGQVIVHYKQGNLLGVDRNSILRFE